MIDLHTHTLHSDGELLPSELVQRAKAAGYEAIALTDHADASNVEELAHRLAVVAKELNAQSGIRVIPGVELTHVPPEHIARMILLAREAGARLVVVHGETPVEPVPAGTNLAAIEAGADILAHPGLITEACAEAAAKLGTALEITSRGGHALTNGHVARMLLKFGGPCVVNSDSHAPGDLLSPEKRRRVILGAGLPEAFLERMQAYSRKLVEKALQIRSHHA